MEYKGNQNDAAIYQEADVSSKRIFGNHTLCAQFLRDYSGLSILADVQPEDIEDVSERYHLFREVELESDTVKKVRLRNQTGGKSQDMYVISLIEHKSSVDYDVTMQILKYMVCIWENYVRELEEEFAAEHAIPDESDVTDGITESPMAGAQAKGKPKKRKRINRRKDFRYPPIYPIVYYEGTGEWTAAWHLKERVLLGELFQAYIPDITYKLVRTREYSNDELLSKEDAISLLMLLNKIQQAEDFQEVSKIPIDCLNEILEKAPVDVVDIIIATVRNLCLRLNLTNRETADLLEKVRGGNMGYLFENMEKMDIQLERRNTAEQRQRAEKAEKDAEEQRQRAEKAEKDAEEQRQRLKEVQKDVKEQRQKVEQDKHALYRILIASYRKHGMTEEEVRQQLMSEAKLSDSEADELIKKFW